MASVSILKVEVAHCVKCGPQVRPNCRPSHSRPLRRTRTSTLFEPVAVRLPRTLHTASTPVIFFNSSERCHTHAAQDAKVRLARCITNPRHKAGRRYTTHKQGSKLAHLKVHRQLNRRPFLLLKQSHTYIRLAVHVQEVTPPTLQRDDHLGALRRRAALLCQPLHLSRPRLSSRSCSGVAPKAATLRSVPSTAAPAWAVSTRRQPPPPSCNHVCGSEVVPLSQPSHPIQHTPPSKSPSSPFHPSYNK